MANIPTITLTDVERELDMLISIEPSPSAIAVTQDYDQMMAPHRVAIIHAYALLRCYVEQLDPASAQDVQDAFQAITNSAKYRLDYLSLSIVCSALTNAWDGLCGWRG